MRRSSFSYRKWIDNAYDHLVLFNLYVTIVRPEVTVPIRATRRFLKEARKRKETKRAYAIDSCVSVVRRVSIQRSGYKERKGPFARIVLYLRVWEPRKREREANAKRRKKGKRRKENKKERKEGKKVQRRWVTSISVGVKSLDSKTLFRRPRRARVYTAKRSVDN